MRGIWGVGEKRKAEKRRGWDGGKEIAVLVLLPVHCFSDLGPVSKARSVWELSLDGPDGLSCFHVTPLMVWHRQRKARALDSTLSTIIEPRLSLIKLCHDFVPWEII